MLPPSTPSKQIKRTYDLLDSPSKRKPRRKRECYFNKLPDELVEMILSNLDRKTLLKLLRVDKRLHFVVLPRVYNNILLNNASSIFSIPNTMSLYTLKSQSVDVNTALNEQSHIEALSDIINNQKDNLIHLSITIIKTDNNNLNYLYESISRLNKLRSISIFYEEDEEIEQNNSDRLAKLITVLPKTTKIVYLFSGWYTAWNELLSAEFEHLRIRIWNEEDK